MQTPLSEPCLNLAYCLTPWREAVLGVIKVFHYFPDVNFAQARFYLETLGGIHTGKLGVDSHNKWSGTVLY